MSIAYFIWATLKVPQGYYSDISLNTNLCDLLIKLLIVISETISSTVYYYSSKKTLRCAPFLILPKNVILPTFCVCTSYGMKSFGDPKEHWGVKICLNCSCCYCVKVLLILMLLRKGAVTLAFTVINVC